jgi:hypothetical protein
MGDIHKLQTKPFASADARAALSEIRAENLRVAYVARRSDPVNVAPEVQDVTPRKRIAMPRGLLIALYVIVAGLVALAVAGCEKTYSEAEVNARIKTCRDDGGTLTVWADNGVVYGTRCTLVYK